MSKYIISLGTALSDVLERVASAQPARFCGTQPTNTKKTKLATIWGIALVARCATLLGCFIIVSQIAAAEPTKVEWQKDPEYQQLLRERVESASQLYEAEKRKSDIGKTTMEAVYLAAKRLRDARLDLGAQAATVILAEHLAVMREMEKAEKSRVSFNPEAAKRAEELARYWRISAEIALKRAQKASVTPAAAEATKVEWQKDPAYQQLLRERVESASQLYEVERRKSDVGKTTMEAVYLAAKRLRDARLDLAAQPDTVIRTEYLTIMRQMEKEEKSRIQVPGPGPEAVAQSQELARYWRLGAELDLFRAQKTIAK